MILNHTNDSTTDTDKLPDIEAAILEKSKELQKLCSENDRPMLLFVCPSGNTKSQVLHRSWFSFFHTRGKDNVSENGGVDIGPLAACINSFFAKMIRPMPNQE